MITLYCRTGCPRCASVRDALEELAIDARIVELAEGSPLPGEVPAAARLPVLMDDGEPHVGSEAAIEHIEELRRFRDDWYRFQSDACYCEEEETEAR